MKTTRIISFFGFVVLALIVSACGAKTAPGTYKTVSTGTLTADSVIPAPTGPVILTIDGKISKTNVDKTLQLDMATLESMGLVEYTVDDPFSKKKVAFSGVLISQFLQVIGADKNATTLKLLALDDYSTDMKISDTLKWPIIIATKADGKYMPIDQKGPVLTVLPFNDFPEIDHVSYDLQWVWSLTKITVQ